MDWNAVQLGVSALALGAVAFGFTWWDSVRFDRRWHPSKPAEADLVKTRPEDITRHRPAA